MSLEDNQKNIINDRVGKSTLSSDDGYSLLKNGGGEAFTPKSICIWNSR